MIYIRVDANHDRGMGHLYRMLTLSDNLISRKQSIRFIARSDDAVKKILDSKGADYTAFPSVTKEKDIIRASLTDQGPLPDMWIFDILDTDIDWLGSIKEKGVKVVCFDDTKGALEGADLAINAFVHLWGKYTLKEAKTRVLEGFDYSIIDPRAILYRKKRVIAKDESLKIAISMGGSDTHGSSLIIIEALAALVSGKHSLHLFTGPGFLHQKELDSLIRSLSFKIPVRHAASDLHRELDPMDVVICAGGMTLLEVCAMGLPALAFANEPHEEKSIDYIASLRGCLPIGSSRTIDKKILSAKIGEYLSDSALLNETAASAIRCVSDGTDKCAQSILDLL